jgi:hypothetical protein
VKPGAIIEIGSARIQLLEAPPDYDAGVEISTLDKTEEKALKAALAKPQHLDQTWLSKRRPAWLVFTLTAVFFFALPIMTHFSPGWSSVLRKIPLIPSQESWSPGALDASHQFFGGDCTVCHEKPFVQVRDDACGRRCHARTAAHADPAKFNLPELGTARCSSCHQDHNGATGLVRTNQSLCGACHVDLKARTKGASALADVGDFGTSHPDFLVDLPNWDANGKFAPVRTRLDTPNLKELSGLKYPHDKHLTADGLKTPNGLKVLACKDCHVPEPGGAKMKPVNFVTMCQDCHRLDFDPNEPERQVPHAKVAEIIFMLDEFYAERALVGGYNDLSAPVHRAAAPPTRRGDDAAAAAGGAELGAPEVAPGLGHAVREPRLHRVPHGHAQQHAGPAVRGRAGARRRHLVPAQRVHAPEARDHVVRRLPRRQDLEGQRRPDDPRHRELPRMPRRRARQGQGGLGLRRLPRLPRVQVPGAVGVAGAGREAQRRHVPATK